MAREGASLPRRWSAWLRRRRAARSWRALGAWRRLTASRWDYPRWIDLPDGENVLTLSPHPDDDVIGAGGTLLKHHQAGHRTTTLVLTDGGAGDPSRPRHEVVRARRREQEAAARLLGVEKVCFWDEADGTLAARPDLVRRLRGFLTELEPELVFLPSFLDPHPDHQAVTPLLAQAVRGTDLAFRCAVYETYTTIPANVLVDVSRQMETKLRALAAHESQLGAVDYPALVRGLGRWRTGARSLDVEYAEAFYMDDVRGYLGLWRDVASA